MTLSSREKVLIVVLLLVAIIVGGYKLLIEPDIKQATELSSQLESLREQQIQMRSTAEIEATINDRIAEQRKQAIDSAATFFDDLNASDLRIWINKLVVDSGASVKAVSITAPITVVLGKAADTAGKLSYPIDEYATKILKEQAQSQALGETAATASAEAAVDTVMASDVELSLNATLQQAMTLLDKVNQSKKTVKADFFKFESTGDKNQETVITVNLNFYAVKKIK